MKYRTNSKLVWLCSFSALLYLGCLFLWREIINLQTNNITYNEINYTQELVPTNIKVGVQALEINHLLRQKCLFAISKSNRSKIANHLFNKNSLGCYSICQRFLILNQNIYSNFVSAKVNLNDKINDILGIINSDNLTICTARILAKFSKENASNYLRSKINIERRAVEEIVKIWAVNESKNFISWSLMQYDDNFRDLLLFEMSKKMIHFDIYLSLNTCKLVTSESLKQQSLSNIFTVLKSKYGHAKALQIIEENFSISYVL